MAQSLETGGEGKPSPKIKSFCPVCGIGVKEASRCKRCGEKYFCEKHIRGGVCNECNRDLKNTRKMRAAIFETPVSEQQGLLEAEAEQNPALRPKEEFRTFTELPEDEVEEEDNEAELLGEDGEDYSADKDLDFSEIDEASLLRETSDDEEFYFSLTPDLMVEELIVGTEKEFLLNAEGGEMAEIWQADEDFKGTLFYRRARIILDFLRERRHRIREIGEILIEKQKDYFESDDVENALKNLKPLTQEEVARRMGLHKGTVNRLVSKSFVQTPRFGLVSMDLFFGSSGGRLPRHDVLVIWIREIIRQHPKATSGDIRRALEGKNIIPKSQTDKEKKYTERMIGNVLKDYNIPGSRERRRD